MPRKPLLQEPMSTVDLISSCEVLGSIIYFAEESSWLNYDFPSGFSFILNNFQSNYFEIIIVKYIIRFVTAKNNLLWYPMRLPPKCLTVSCWGIPEGIPRTFSLVLVVVSRLRGARLRQSLRISRLLSLGPWRPFQYLLANNLSTPWRQNKPATGDAFRSPGGRMQRQGLNLSFAAGFLTDQTPRPMGQREYQHLVETSYRRRAPKWHPTTASISATQYPSSNKSYLSGNYQLHSIYGNYGLRSFLRGGIPSGIPQYFFILLARYFFSIFSFNNLHLMSRMFLQNFIIQL